MKHFWLLILVLGITSTTFAQPKDANAAGKAEQQLLELNKAWAEAINKGDARALERMFADDLIVTASNGTLRDKAGEIKDAAGAPDPEFSWTSPFETRDLRIKVYQDAAVVTGLAKWGFKYKGQQINNERRFTHTCIRMGGEWKIVAQQTSLNLYKPPAQ